MDDIDILIPLNKGSRQGDLELKYCLRSVEKHLTGVRNLYIVGENPAFLNPLTFVHIPFKESINNWERARNIFDKISAGINYKDLVVEILEGGETVPVRSSGISENFLFMNDDHFLLEDYEARQFVNYCRPLRLEDYKNNPPQYAQMKNTVEELRKFPVLEDREIYDFDIHCPIIFNKNLFRRIFENLPKIWPEHGYGIKTYYSSRVLINEAIRIEDLKFRSPLEKSVIYKILKGHPWFSIGDACLKAGAMKEVLEELYPYKSIYEL